MFILPFMYFTDYRLHGMDDDRSDPTRYSDEDEGNIANNDVLDQEALPSEVPPPQETSFTRIGKCSHHMVSPYFVKNSNLLCSPPPELLQWLEECRDGVDNDPLFAVDKEMLPGCPNHGVARWSCLFDCVPADSTTDPSQRIRALAKQYQRGLPFCPRSCWVSILLTGNCLWRLFGLHRPVTPIPCCRGAIVKWEAYEEELAKMEEEVIKQTMLYAKLTLAAVGVLLLSWKIFD